MNLSPFLDLEIFLQNGACMSLCWGMLSAARGAADSEQPMLRNFLLVLNAVTSVRKPVIIMQGQRKL